MTTRTYLLAPNFDFPPGSSIGLGALLADPLAPHRVLTSLDRAKWPQVTTTTQKDRVIASGRAYDASVSAGSQIMQLIGAKLGGGLARDESTQYSMTALRTEFFADDPSVDDMMDLLQAPRVQSAMQSTFWSRPLYLITGIKIAEGFSLSSSTTTRRNGNAGADAPVSGGVSVGLDVAVSKERSRGDSFTAVNEVILAYRLLKISRKGWKERRLAFEEYRSKSAFLSGDVEQEAYSDEIEVAEATPADFSELDDVNASSQGQTQGECRYIRLSDAGDDNAGLTSSA